MLADEPIAPKAERSAPLSWFPPNGDDTNEPEVLAIALLVCLGTPKVAEINNLVTDVLEAANGTNFVPNSLEWKMVRDKPGAKLEILHYVLRRATWYEPELSKIASAMQAFHGPGRFDGLTVDHIKRWRYLEPKAPKPPGSKDKHGPPRWRSVALVPVAKLLKQRGVELRKILKLDVDREKLPTMEEELEAAMKLNKAYELQIPRLNLEIDRVRDAHRKRDA